MDEQTPVVPTPPAVKKPVPVIWFIGAGILILVIAAALIAFFVFKIERPEQLVDAVANITVPESLKDATFTNGSQSFRLTNAGLEEVEAVRKPEIETVLSTDVNKDAVIKNAVVSPNKTAVAFAQQLSDEEGEGAVDEWQITIALVRRGIQQSFGEGFAAVFITERRLARVTSEGIIEKNTETGAERVLLEKAIDSTNAAASVSPNGGLIAFVDDATGEIAVYGVTPDGLTFVTQYPGAFTSFALKNDALFVLEAGEAGTKVFRLPFAQGAVAEHIYTLPATPEVTGLTF